MLNDSLRQISAKPVNNFRWMLNIPSHKVSDFTLL